jgi:hypothetical protein
MDDGEVVRDAWSGVVMRNAFERRMIATTQKR